MCSRPIVVNNDSQQLAYFMNKRCRDYSVFVRAHLLWNK